MIEAMEWKPCPFCGKAPREWGFEKSGYERHQVDKGTSVLDVGCSACNTWMIYCETKLVPYEDALKELNERWNRRTT